jgi:hypothetical protein
MGPRGSQRDGRLETAVDMRRYESRGSGSLRELFDDFGRFDFDRKPNNLLVTGSFLDAGGGTRTPDTRIMIPAVFRAFTGDPGGIGR